MQPLEPGAAGGFGSAICECRLSECYLCSGALSHRLVRIIFDAPNTHCSPHSHQSYPIYSVPRELAIDDEHAPYYGHWRLPAILPALIIPRLCSAAASLLALAAWHPRLLCRPHAGG